MNPAIYPPAYEFFGVIAIASFLLANLHRSWNGEWNTIGLLGCYGLIVTALHHAFGGLGLFLLPVVFVVLLFLMGGIIWLCDSKYRKMKVRAKKLFPDASELEISFVGNILLEGGFDAELLNEIRWDGIRIVRGNGDKIERITKHGWRPLPAPGNTYPYLAQRTFLDERLSFLGVEVAAERSHFLCSLLYFNWEFSATVVEGNLLTIAMHRRDEKRTERIHCRQVESSNNTAG